MYSYEEVLEKIESGRRFGNLPGVEITRIMLEKLNHPQRELSFIHVAGTNGKGSVCAFLDSIMREAGLKTGCFISPHLVDFRERITVKGQMISKGDVVRLGNRLLSENFGVNPTMFDYCLAMAVLYFREQQCDVAIIETGLGGRLDSTNALGMPEVSVITRIGYDHMAILGNTLHEIAGEKAGILKPGVPAVFAPQEPEALEVLNQHADGICVTEKDMLKAEAMKPALIGDYQRENAAAAMLAAEIYLNKIHASAIGESVKKGIHHAKWQGRMDILSTDPFFMVDGAHNSNGIHALKRSLMKLYPGEKFHFIMGVMADKDYENMVEELLPLAIDFVTVTPDSTRALQGSALADFIERKGVPAQALQRVSDIWKGVKHGEKTIALGSMYFIGELIEQFQKGQHVV